jgi:cysteine desulfurase
MTDWLYLDNNATTRPLPDVVDAMLPYLDTRYANPSSVHQFGQTIRHAVDLARARVAALLGTTPREIIFTAGGTEAINLAIRGTLARVPGRGRLVTTAVEHSATLRVSERLADEGHPVAYVRVDHHGRVDVDDFRSKVTPGTALVSLIHANNETGVVTDLTPLLAHTSALGVPVHLDAVQSAGKVPLNVAELPVQLMSLSAHKFHGPKGVGALYVRRRTRIDPLLVGGGQEQGVRGGTENVAAIIGMGIAAEHAGATLAESNRRVAELRDDFERRVLQAVPFATVIGSEAPRVANTSNIAFEALQAEAILILLSERGICASSGAACSSGSLEPSHVLKAMGIDDRVAHGAIRFSLSRFTTPEEIDFTVDALPELLGRLTALSVA